MKTTIQADTLVIEFPKGGVAQIALSEVTAIDIETIPTMTVDIDIVVFSHESGEFMEITDESEGFSGVTEYLSKRFGISPGIQDRFPADRMTRIYQK